MCCLCFPFRACQTNNTLAHSQDTQPTHHTSLTDYICEYLPSFIIYSQYNWDWAAFGMKYRKKWHHDFCACSMAEACLSFDIFNHMPFYLYFHSLSSWRRWRNWLSVLCYCQAANVRSQKARFELSVLQICGVMVSEVV